MPFKYIKYEDSEGEWICPIDEEKNIIYNTTRYDAVAFCKIWKAGCIISVDEPGSFGDLSPKGKIK